MLDEDLRARAQAVLTQCRTRGLKIATAESCTGGMVAAALTEIAGSSDVFERGFVTYSNEAKQDLLDVPADVIGAFGAVSSQTAEAMALGALKNSRADIAVSITGIAGPAGGSPDRPVGLVHFALARKERPVRLVEKRFPMRGRENIRCAATAFALSLLLEAAAPSQIA